MDNFIDFKISLFLLLLFGLFVEHGVDIGHPWSLIFAPDECAMSCIVYFVELFVFWVQLGPHLVDIGYISKEIGCSSEQSDWDSNIGKIPFGGS